MQENLSYVEGRHYIPMGIYVENMNTWESIVIYVNVCTKYVINCGCEENWKVPMLNRYSYTESHRVFTELI